MTAMGMRPENKRMSGESFPERDATKSATSYRSTHSSRSSVLERAREYNRRIDEKRERAKSLERQSDVSSKSGGATRRSQSAGRVSSQGNRMSTRERAMASVRNEEGGRQMLSPGGSSSHYSQSSHRPTPTTPRSHASRTRDDYSTASRSYREEASSKSKPSPPRSARSKGDQAQEAIVTPELLVDALSGHEDGLLAIAERLMEHYDSGYDAMGEAIIDAFADVQKLFQHVVEAAHMEGAAFEASRREEEIAELKRQAAAPAVEEPPITPASANTTGGPSRHDEFIDEDVKEILTEAIKKGAGLKDANKHAECYQLYEQACQSSSSLLPVDSDHRGRLQLSIARAESMSPDRACAILRYAMDDVLRSGLRAGKTPLPDVSKRGDVVLSKPFARGSTAAGQVVQSSEEALSSLVEEMKEVLGAPVYDNTPLQSVADRFWKALSEAQKAQHKNEERLEHNLGKLKGEFLLARAEWEEKLTKSQEEANSFKRKYMRSLDGTRGEKFMEHARTATNKLHQNEDLNVSFGESVRSNGTRATTGSVTSIGSGLAQQARSLVGNFSCAGNNERNGGIMASELAEARESEYRDRRHMASSPGRSRSAGNPVDPRYSHGTAASGRSARSRRGSKSRSFQEYSQSPQRVDI